MYTRTKIKSKQIMMAVLTAIALMIGIVSSIDVTWIAKAVGRFEQFFYWGFYKIFNGLESAYSSVEVYNNFANNESLRAVCPLLTMESVIMICFMVLIALPLGILIEKAAYRNYEHFNALHGWLFGLSVSEWIALPVILMQFMPNSPIVLGLSDSALVVVLHIWFYLTLLTYMVMANIYSVTGRYEIYEIAHAKIGAVWNVCFKAWKGIAVVTVIAATFGIYIILRIAFRTSMWGWRASDDMNVFY